MIKTKDRRKFFTHETNYLPLLEFSKLFKAEISIVKVKQAQVLTLADLAPALPNPQYKVVQIKISQNKRKRQDILDNAKKVRAQIRKQFLTGKTVSLKELCGTFEGLKVSPACICHHMRIVREELEHEGCKIIKVGGGKYKKE
jgi:hypothetical protein